MGAETTGRKLGIGVRLFARAARQGVAAAAASSTRPQAGVASASSPLAGRQSSYSARAAAEEIQNKADGFARGAKQFGQAMVGPVAHTGGVLWLEITGLLFGLIALFFAQNVYRFRLSWKNGPDHTIFLLCAAVTILFAAFTFTQFYKARSKERKNRARRAKIHR